MAGKAAKHESANPESSEIEDTVGTKNYTAPKGRPTPKRERRPALTAPPKDNKEARKRMRQQLKSERAERFDGMRRGDDNYLPKRDQGPVRQLARDVVDSRRNLGPLFFIGTLVVMLGTQQFIPLPPQIRTIVSDLWLFLIVVMVGDIFLLVRQLRKALTARLPEEPHGVGLYGYAIMRSVVFRRWRNPDPQVELGDPL
ncbi:MAG TPA: DUF3043 domain-containing protein [Mycobacteriales bacterium]|nr:DUF3043 domain-containing protein [Mycobacteriales bacterium]